MAQLAPRVPARLDCIKKRLVDDKRNLYIFEDVRYHGLSEHEESEGKRENHNGLLKYNVDNAEK